MTEDAHEDRPQRWDTTRVEAFSDGVFAIAITLLVLEIRVDPADYDNLRHALLHEWPAYLAYVTSFLTVGSVWLAHHRFFMHLRYVDPVLLRLNLLLLMAAAFLPFPTGVLAQALHASDSAERTAVAFYGLTALVIELLIRASIRYAASHPELADVPEGMQRRGGGERDRGRDWRQLLTATFYAAGILAGIFVFPRIAVVAYLLLAVRGVLVVDNEGRLNVRGLLRRR